MIGFSVYLANVDQNTEKDIKKMKDLGFKGIFTSLHIPEEEPSKYKERLKLLGKIASKFQLELMADISPKSLSYLGLDWGNANRLMEWGVSGLRVDYGVTEEMVAFLSRKMKIALNASTIRENQVKLLQKYGANFKNMEAWHNYYPRPETGLAMSNFNEINAWLKKEGFTVMAFVPGDGTRRGPLFQGLPTLEKHRKMSSFAAFLELYENKWVDKIYIGDPSVDQWSGEQFRMFLKEDVILLHAKRFVNRPDINKYFESIQSNRPDEARDVIRSAESRLMALPGDSKIEPFHTVERPIGSITIDNERYGRYQGEIQITKRDLPKDEKVNVIGRVINRDLPLLPYIKGGQKFAVQWKE